MAYNFSDFKLAGEAALDWLKKEYSVVRNNQATPTILDGVLVESYGSKVPINQVASVLGAGPKSLLITPWDKNVTSDIDRAIRESNLGVSVVLDGQGIRVSFPDLTSERRIVLVKIVKEKFEEARIRVRSEREKNLSEIDKSDFSKDDKFRLKNELQKLVEEINGKLETLASKKEQEILE